MRWLSNRNTLQAHLCHTQARPRFEERIYARAGIQVYWIINLIDNQVEIYTEPAGEAENPDYQRREDYSLDDEIPVVIDGREVSRLAARELLP